MAFPLARFYFGGLQVMIIRSTGVISRERERLRGVRAFNVFISMNRPKLPSFEFKIASVSGLRTETQRGIRAEKKNKKKKKKAEFSIDQADSTDPANRLVKNS